MDGTVADLGWICSTNFDISSYKELAISELGERIDVKMRWRNRASIVEGQR